MFFDPEGNPMTLDEWALAFEHREDWRRVARDVVGFGPDKKIVSTIWMGLDYNHGEGKRQIFETMLFQKRGGVRLLCARYADKDEAIEGHDYYVDKYRYNRRQRRKDVYEM